jgi:thiol-disulfide isomerase/thioredoxin
VNKLRIALVAGGMLLAWQFNSAWAAPHHTVYVMNQDVGEAVPINGVDFVLADAMARAARIDVRVDPQTRIVSVNGDLTPLKAVRTKSGGWLVPLAGVTSYANLRMRTNGTVGVIDIYRPVNGEAIVDTHHKPVGPLVTVTTVKDRLRVVNKGLEGEETRLEKYVVPGKLNIFVFFSPHCDPYERMAPALQTLAEKRRDVVISKINVNRPDSKDDIDWNSPIMSEFKVDTLPYFVVYDEKGKKKSDGEVAHKEVLDMFTEVGTAPLPKPATADTDSVKKPGSAAAEASATPAATTAAASPSPAASPAKPSPSPAASGTPAASASPAATASPAPAQTTAPAPAPSDTPSSAPGLPGYGHSESTDKPANGY